MSSKRPLYGCEEGECAGKHFGLYDLRPCHIWFTPIGTNGSASRCPNVD